jgi:hypothetical protein
MSLNKAIGVSNGIDCRPHISSVVKLDFAHIKHEIFL